MGTIIFTLEMILACVAIFILRKLRAMGTLKLVDYIVVSVFTLFSTVAALTCLEEFFPSIFSLVNAQMLPQRTPYEKLIVNLYYQGSINAISTVFNVLFIIVYFKLRGFKIVHTMTAYMIVYAICASPSIFFISGIILAIFVGC